jgi:hypothetical protein
LLRLLNERKTADGSQIPLCTAIATANPARADYYNEPLDPANLDRFALQLCTDGLVHDKVHCCCYCCCCCRRRCRRRRRRRCCCCCCCLVLC